MPHHTGTALTTMTTHTLIDLAMLIPFMIHITLHHTPTEAHIIDQAMLAHTTPDIEVTPLTQPGWTPPDTLLHPQLLPTLPHIRLRSLLNPQVRRRLPLMITPQLALPILTLLQPDLSHMLIMIILIQDILHHTTLHITADHMSPHTPETSLPTEESQIH